MKRVFWILSLSVILFSQACTEDELPVPEGYPTTINALSRVEKSTLLEQLGNTALAPCVYIDTFGIPFMTVNDALCVDRSWSMSHTYEEIISAFYTALVDYAYFLNVNDPTKLNVAGVYVADGTSYDQFKKEYPDSSPSAWVVISKLQSVDGLKVRGSKISVLLSPNGASGIYGTNYNDIFIPASDNFDEEAAKQSLFNTTLGTGRNEIVITENTVWYSSEKLLLPLKKSDKIEIRHCWALHPGDWEVIVDTQTGEKLTTINISNIR